MSNIEHPLPHASFESLGYWEGTSRNELVLQRCNTCQIVQHRPRGMCVNCLDASNLEHFVASGKGTIYTYTVTEQNQAKGFAKACPYVLAYVDLEEGSRILANIVDCDPYNVSVGAEVMVKFVTQERPDAESFAVPVFTLS
jgi:hypothetical protein|tara:strand:+ start:4032 stop:4454 length:423 start_codon:yes stop_codon:yes gene_type:complete